MARPAGPGATVRLRRLVRAIAATLLALGTVAFVGGPATGATSDTCLYPSLVIPNTWTVLRTPPGSTSVAEMDQDPCRLIATARTPFDDGEVWLSSDAGQQWHLDTVAPPLTRVLTERLAKPARGKWMGDVLATGPLAPSADSGITVDPVQQVYTSADGGEHYDESVLGAGASGLPLQANLLSGATVIRYTNGAPTPVLYVVAAVAHHDGVAVAQSVSVDRELLSSTDGGHSFAPAGSGTGFAPTVLDVNPQNQNEVWVNSIGSGAPGGAWKSTDGGTTWQPACCTTDAVHDIAFGPGTNGSTSVYVATDHGLLVSQDDGADWASVTTAPVDGVRTVPDAPGVVIAVTADHRVLAWMKPGKPPVAIPGLPGDCSPDGLRRDAIVPPTFLVTCASGATYRMLLDGYGVGGSWPGGTGSGGGLPTPPASPATAVQLTQLATWALPQANNESGAIAFDGTYLYYDDWAGGVRRIRAADGEYGGQLPLPGYLTPSGLTVDLKQNRLLIVSGDMYGYSLARRTLKSFGRAPYIVPTFDASTDGLSWVPTQDTVLDRSSIEGGRWDVQTICTGIPSYGVGSDNSPSTFVADGDGGGYVQSEDDITLYRIDKQCHLVGALYKHRQYSESGEENDAMACDMQTFFPQAAIWIRDSTPKTVTAYAVPYGYCPMPSRLTVAAPATVSSGSVTTVCTLLTNATTGEPAADRGVTLSIRGASLGNARTGADGRACFTYLAPTIPNGHRLPLDANAAFAGDPSLYLSSGSARMVVVAAAPALVAAGGPPVLPPPPPAEPPPMNAPNAPVQAPGPATNIAQAQQGQAQAQSQPGLQGVVVAQQEQQPQLALATVVNQLEANTAGQNAMTAFNARPQPGPGLPAALLVGVGAACMGAASVLGRAVAQVNPQRRRRNAPDRKRSAR